MTTGKGSIKRFSLHFSHHMGNIIITSVGYCRTEIGNLKRCQQHLTLSNRNGYDGQTIPRAFIGLIVELGIRNQTTLLSGKIDTQLITESHADHIVSPDIHRILHRSIFGDIGIDHVVKSPAEETIARSTEGRYDRQRRGMAVTTHMQSFEVEAMSAWIRGRRSDNSFRKESESLRSFEGRTRGIETHDTTVE